MSWFEKLMPSRISTEKRTKSVPEGVWIKCGACDAQLYRNELERNLHVCPKCSHHMRIEPSLLDVRIDVISHKGKGDVAGGSRIAVRLRNCLGGGGGIRLHETRGDGKPEPVDRVEKEHHQPEAIPDGSVRGRVGGGGFLDMRWRWWNGAHLLRVYLLCS